MNAPRALRSAAGQLRLEWPDGQISQLSHARLRAACPCSQCRAARLHGRIDTAPSEVRLRAISQQGYGVQLVFSDGHDKGIFPWSYLRDMDLAIEGKWRELRVFTREPLAEAWRQSRNSGSSYIQ